MTNYPTITTLGELKTTGYTPKSIKQELRDNLIHNIQNGIQSFEGVWGFEDSVIPDIERAILSGHNFNLLGLRGQAKTKIARHLITLLDEYIPIIDGSEINDDPFAPISKYGKSIVEEKGDATPISWWHRNDRFTEKLATPDVTVADLIGDIDPIKAATLKLPYSDERVLHFGLIPRANRSLFVINELPDLQARIQVALFNILQEGDIQIRGFKLRLPLDIQFVFTANPEDYTNRGSIVTPLKDRIGSQILTHYPKSIEIGKKITAQETAHFEDQQKTVHVQEIVKDLIEQIAIEARASEYVDEKSGVSARLTISAFENLISAAHLRALKNKEQSTNVRIVDFIGVIPAITGKIELVYEGEQEGVSIVSQNLIGKAIRSIFTEYFPDPETSRKTEKNPYKPILQWFNEGNKIELIQNMSSEEYEKTLYAIPGLADIIFDMDKSIKKEEQTFFMEFVLNGLAEYSQLSKHFLTTGTQFQDLLSSMLSFENLEDDENT